MMLELIAIQLFGIGIAVTLRQDWLILVVLLAAVADVAMHIHMGTF